jgi:hypothetical protein
LKAYALGYSFIELFKRAQLRIDIGFSPMLKELDRSFGHQRSPCRDQSGPGGKPRPCDHLNEHQPGQVAGSSTI